MSDVCLSWFHSRLRSWRFGVVTVLSVRLAEFRLRNQYASVVLWFYSSLMCVFFKYFLWQVRIAWSSICFAQHFFSAFGANRYTVPALYVHARVFCVGIATTFVFVVNFWWDALCELLRTLLLVNYVISEMHSHITDAHGYHCTWTNRGSSVVIYSAQWTSTFHHVDAKVYLTEGGRNVVDCGWKQTRLHFTQRPYLYLSG